ncbi:MAG: DUF2442 domain-containing protein [Candidatus Latescibacterota bacterium]
MNPRVQAVVAEDGHQLRLIFTNGEVRIYDCSHLLDWGVFRELRTAAYFRQVQAAHGTVVWPNEQDICPDTLYEESRPVEDAATDGIPAMAPSRG